ncbi:general odorant-binding protein 56h-like [Lucilia sericata]|uniref:general odorant-binding protein 56h-like n=1 Tax=Lucilia sericata TaxID=13632 RepID=UPI0018A86D87|nr:general odorant-binding protein 56h-like [Lucilia sericata]
MNFYIIFITVILALVQVKAYMKEMLDKIDMACREEVPVSENELYTFYGNYKQKPEEAIMCLLKCYVEKHGSWKNGAFDENGAREYLLGIPTLRYRPDAVSKIIDDCKHQKGSSECHTAYLIIVCMTEHEAVIV